MTFYDRQTNHTYAAKQTEYAGVVFRSRLEARWAVCLDTLEVTWSYEPRMFSTPEGGYIPDFLVRTKKPFWVEVKGPEPIERDYVRAAHVQKMTNRKLRFLVGQVPQAPSHGILRTRVLSGRKWRQADWQTPWSAQQLDHALSYAIAYDFDLTWS